MRTPVQAIRHKCLECMCQQYNFVRDCPSDGINSKRKCDLYDYRMGRFTGTEYVYPGAAIRAFCLDCVGSPQEVASCQEGNWCALHRYRSGKNPVRSRSSAARDVSHLEEYRFEKGHKRNA